MEQRSSFLLVIMLIWLQASSTLSGTFRPPSEVHLEKKREEYPSNNERLESPETDRVYPTRLENGGHPPVPPFPTVKQYNAPEPAGNPNFTQGNPNAPQIPGATSIIPTTPPSVPSSSPINSSRSLPLAPTSVPSNSFLAMEDQDVFQPLPPDPIPSNIQQRNDHPVPKLGIANTSDPVPTNKFFGSFFLGNQTSPVFTHPYSLVWGRGIGGIQTWGMSISQIDADLLAFGQPDPRLPGDPVSNYINPIGLKYIMLSAAEFGPSTVLNTDGLSAFSAQAILRSQPGSSQRITFPVVQGMGFVTGVYSYLEPIVQSGVGIQNLDVAGSPKPGIFKYRAMLEDGGTWLIYITPANGTDPHLHLESPSSLRGDSGFSGTIQVAKNPLGDTGEQLYDNSAGVYAVTGNVTGTVSGPTGNYSLSWEKAGINPESTPLLMFALPHHLESFDDDTKTCQTPLILRTTTKGNATAVTGESWTMVVPDLPIDIGFAPWSPSMPNATALSPAAQQAIRDAASQELQENMDAETNLDSIYFSGKALSKFATMIYTIRILLNDTQLTDPALQTLKSCFARFASNQQKWPLVYDTVWKGVVSSATYVTHDSGVDFGNTYYNDHHFHYGYFVHTAAIIGFLDPSWVAANRAYVNTLIRDAGNSVANDPLFPFSRTFDWFHGHSWAKGLFDSSDGKDQESTSEDALFAYALKMWGNISGDKSLEARGNLMLGILRRSLINYFLLESDNVNQPPQFIGNKVTGILFENKVDHTTYFGTNLEYIQGIHMLPILPNSAYTRPNKFVTEEWNAIFAPNASTPADTVAGGWRGVLYSNLAIIDPVASYKFFTQPNFDYSWIDGGTSRVWLLAYAASLGGSP
ncbi:Endo-1,3(4)-beta-glucanase [Elaphomyces granulatus]